MKRYVFSGQSQCGNTIVLSNIVGLFKLIILSTVYSIHVHVALLLV